MAQSAQVRSLVAVDTAVVNEPAAHGSLACVHASALLLSEKAVPGWHAMHERSAVAEPSVRRPSPAAQVRQAEHAPLPCEDLKVLAGQAEQTRSLSAVKGLDMYLPSAHGVLTGWHALPSLVAEKVDVPSQTVHTRFAVAEPAAVSP